MTGLIVLAGGDTKRGLALKDKLAPYEYEIEYCRSLRDFRAAINRGNIAAILLLYPDKRGLINKLFDEYMTSVLCNGVPLVFISPSAKENGALRSLAYRADEFLIEPVSTDEITNVINNATGSSHENSLRPDATRENKREHFLSTGSLILNKETLVVTWRNRNLPLYPLQVHILEFLMQNPGRPIARKELLNRVWKEDINVDDRTVDRNIKRIRDVFRRKAGIDPIRTIRFVGYQFNDQFEQLSSLQEKTRGIRKPDQLRAARIAR